MTLTNSRMTQIIERAMEIIERGWTRGDLARDANGYPVAVASPAACTFCAVGAISRATRELSDRYDPVVQYEVCTKVRELGLPPREKGSQITSFNDRQKRVGPVLTAFRRTIKRLKNQ